MVIDRLDIAAVVVVVNGWGTVPREAGRRDDFPAAPDELLPAWAAADSKTLQRAADALFPVFADPDPLHRIRALAGLLERTGVRPTVELTGSRSRAAWYVDDARDGVLAAAALALRKQLAEHDSSRIGLCAADNCADVYVDVSARAHRRFCSVTCQNRTRIAAYRRRTA
ncbi:CGNR zinc finger domain-containing protein [Kribbella sp. NPDC006257]|uniref:CGNR zinc finger domain-containing protein n=1 Tax=Kribbella sp. NPDC006257 TaxID=3156738 RepID=UPI0033A57F50